MAPDGKRYRSVFCKHWQIVTDKEIPIANFRSTERWTVFGRVNGKIKMILPGCKVDGFFACDECPQSTETFFDDAAKTEKPLGIFNLDENKGYF